MSKKRNLKKLYSSTIVIAILFVIGSYILYKNSFSFAVSVNDSIIANVKTEEEINEVLLQLDEIVESNFNEDAYINSNISFEKVKTDERDVIEKDILLKQLLSNVEIYKPSKRLIVDDDEIIIVEKDSNIEILMDNIKENILNTFDSSIETMDEEFLQTVILEDVDSNVELIFPQAILNYVLDPFFENDELLLADIKLPVISEEISYENINQSDLDKIKQTPLQLVSYTFEEKTVTLGFSNEKRKDDTMYVGDDRIIQEGKYGSKKVITKFKYVNGELESSEIVEEEIIVAPVTRIFVEGTKKYIKPVVVTGGLSGKIIMLDPGHGGRDPGAVNNALGIKEVDFNNHLTLTVARMLRESGATVLFTRLPENNVFISLKDRATISNQSNAHLFVSIHHDNTSNSNRSGISVHYSNYRPGLADGEAIVIYQGEKYPLIREILINDKSYIEFEIDGETVSKSIDVVDVEVEDGKISQVALESQRLAQNIYNSMLQLEFGNGNYMREYNYYVTRWTNVPSVLVEAGFISNKADVERISDPNFHEQIAYKIVQGITNFFN